MTNYACGMILTNGEWCLLDRGHGGEHSCIDPNVDNNDCYRGPRGEPVKVSVLAKLHNIIDQYLDGLPAEEQARRWDALEAYCKSKRGKT